MPYVVRWIVSGQRRINETPFPYSNAGEAIGFACIVLRHQPTEIWIEGPRGIRIEKETI
jgi:hypothetical protein